jgi:hypothetical protein
VTASPGRDTAAGTPTPMARIYQFPTQREGGATGGRRRSPLHDTGAPAKPGGRPVSNKALNWAWTVPVRGTRQHVLLALAKKARPTSEVATPSMPELVEMTGLSESTIRGHLQALALMGVIDAEVSNGGRYKRSTYRLLLEAECGSPTPQEVRGREGVETPQEMDPSEPETPQELRKNPPTDTPVVLRTKGGKRGGSASAAAASAQDEAGLFDAPASKPSRALAVADRKAVAELNAGDAVGAWVDGYVATHDAKPTSRQIGQVGRESRQLLEAGNPPARVVAAAKAAGERGFPMVERQYRDMSQRTGAAAPPAAARPSTTDIRVGAALALAAKYADQEAG